MARTTDIEMNEPVRVTADRGRGRPKTEDRFSPALRERCDKALEELRQARHDVIEVFKLSGLVPMEEKHEVLQAQFRKITAARNAYATWQMIGDAMSISPSAAQQWYKNNGGRK